MIKKLFYLIIPLIFISFSQNVKAKENKIFNNYTTFEEEHIEYYFTSDILESNFYTDYNKFDINARKTSSKSQMNNIKNAIDNNTYSEYGKYYMVITEDASNYNYLIYFNDLNDFTFVKTSVNQFKPYCVDCVAIRFDQGSISKPTRYINNFPTSTYDLIIYSDNSLHVGFNYKKYIYFSSEDVYNAFFEYNYTLLPKLSYTLKPIYKDGYISSYGIKVKSSIVDDSLYKYQYSINDNIDDEFNWVDLYNNNFLNNEFSYITKKPIYFYFRVVDKTNNDVIDSFTITLTFDIVSPQYNIIFNQSKFYLNGTNIIDRLGISITYKTSVDGLKYQYQYVEDGSSLDENNWVDTESDIFQVYRVNGVMYARILDNDNNVLYSSSFTNKLIGKQDTLENPNNFPLYNQVQSVLNFTHGSISDLVLIPVKVLMFMSDSLNNKSCTEYSFGSLLGHELKLPCIDIKSYVGTTIYNFYDLVCSFFISLGIVKFLKNIYMKFMTLEIKDTDNKGGIF